MTEYQSEKFHQLIETLDNICIEANKQRLWKLSAYLHTAKQDLEELIKLLKEDKNEKTQEKQ